MEEENNGAEKKSKSKGERRRSSSRLEVEDARDEIKKFKENLLQSLSTGENEISVHYTVLFQKHRKNSNTTDYFYFSSGIAESGTEITIPQQSRSRSASRAREALCIPANVQAEMDENKIFELKEAFLLFDMDGDGCIDFNDLRATLVSLGDRVDEQAVRNMLAEAPNPLDFDGFVNLLGYRTLELDSEETLVAALSRWDKDNTGYISEERIRHDLMTWGDRFTEKEADYALDEAPTIQKDGSTFIDYVRFCNTLSGLRKPNKA